MLLTGIFHGLLAVRKNEWLVNYNLLRDNDLASYFLYNENLVLILLQTLQILSERQFTPLPLVSYSPMESLASRICSLSGRLTV